MKKFGMIIIAQLCAYCLHGEMTVGGTLVISEEIGAMEFAHEYESNGMSSPYELGWFLSNKLKNSGCAPRRLAANATIEVQALPGMRKIAVGKTDAFGRFSIPVPSDTSYCRVASSVVLRRDGKDLNFEGFRSLDTPENGIEVVLRRESISLCGRCLSSDGNPVPDVVVSIDQFPRSDSLTIPTEYGVTDTAGCWRVDGLYAPGILSAASYINNTNIFLTSSKSMDSPLEAQITYTKSNSKDCLAKVLMPMITDGLRHAAEMFMHTYSQRNSMELKRQNPLVDFPTSTNNVIYVQDIMLP